MSIQTKPNIKENKTINKSMMDKNEKKIMISNQI